MALSKSLSDIFSILEDLPDFYGITISSIDTIGNFGNTPLGVMSSRGDLNSVRVLLENGADINHHGDGGYTPLHEAAGRGYIYVVRFLLERGADPREVDDDGLTPRQIALHCGNLLVADLIDGFNQV